MSDKEESKSLLVHLLIKLGLVERGFYGKLTLHFQKGKVEHYTTEKSGKL